MSEFYSDLLGALAGDIGPVALRDEYRLGTKLCDHSNVFQSILKFRNPFGSLDG